MHRSILAAALALGLGVGSLAISADGAAAAECRRQGRPGTAPLCEPGEATPGTVRYSAFPGGNVIVNTNPATDSCQLFSEPPVNQVGRYWTTVAWGNRSQGCLPYVID